MISEMTPRGKPSMTASREGRPVGRISRGLKSERNPSVVERAALGFMQFRLFFARPIVALKKGIVNGLDARFDRNSGRMKRRLLPTCGAIGGLAQTPVFLRRWSVHKYNLCCCLPQERAHH